MKAKKINIIKFIVLGLVILWVALFLVDYFRARDGKMPLICLAKDTIKYEDGEVHYCTSLGYKMYKYERTSISASVEFGPFFIKERTK